MNSAPRVSPKLAILKTISAWRWRRNRPSIIASVSPIPEPGARIPVWSGAMAKVDVAFTPGQIVRFAGADAIVVEASGHNGEAGYLVESGGVRLPMWLPATVLANHQRDGGGPDAFSRSVPHVLAVDNFFSDPDEIRAIALAQEYREDLRCYKGLRSTQRFLWPHLREELGRLLGTPVTKWLDHGANGVFQQTSYLDPLVWHHDTQSYAAAVYLTPDAPPQSGTSFWRDRVHGCRRRPDHPFERKRLGGEQAVAAARSVVYDLEHRARRQLRADGIRCRPVQPPSDMGRCAVSLGHHLRPLHRRRQRAHPPGAAVLLRHLNWLGKLLTGGTCTVRQRRFFMADGCHRSGA